jgi:hypothetical protein
MGFFKVKKARAAHVGKSNYFAKRGGAGKVKKGGSDKRPPPVPAKSCLSPPV